VNYNLVKGTFEKFENQEDTRKYFELLSPGNFQRDDSVLTSELLLGLRWVVLFDASFKNLYFGMWFDDLGTLVLEDVLCLSCLLLLIEIAWFEAYIDLILLSKSFMDGGSQFGTFRLI
jgi:hypothetical protein